jgi:hypothetical protein
MATKKFPSEMDDRGVVKVTDKLMIHNIDTGLTEYTTVAELLAALSTFAAGQIGFPAVQIPSADVNTLDDYKEGTFTPVLEFGGAASGIAYSSQVGNYTKIGNRVFAYIYIMLTSNGSSSGAATISGLPYSASGFDVVELYLNGITFADKPQARVNGSTIDLMEITNAGVCTSLNDTNFPDNCNLIANLAYKV